MITLILGVSLIISIHASAREATTRGSAKVKKDEISIHASAREATGLGWKSDDAEQFQSTPPRGRRHIVRLRDKLIIYFNPRLREGGDAIKPFLNSSNFNFNPRLREGGDIIPQIADADGGDISIHASAREATYYYPQTTFFHSISIHASAREATSKNAFCGFIPFISIHASAREATPPGQPQERMDDISIHASAREAT